MSIDLETRRRRAIYRAEHRGTKEMDLVLGPFARARIQAMDEAQLAHFEALLLEPDPELQEMVFGSTPPSTTYADLMAEIRAFHGLMAS